MDFVGIVTAGIPVTGASIFEIAIETPSIA
jgi:hypothetical protein